MDPGYFLDDQLGEAEYRTSFDGPDTAVCVACWRPSFGLLCHDCEQVVNRLGVSA